MTCAHRVSAVACVVGALALPAAAAQAQGDRTANLFRESYALESARDYPGALARVREARAGGSAPYFATIRMGWLSYLHGDFTASIASYSEAIAAEPNAIEPKIGLTLPLLAQQNWRELERACNAVLASDPRNATGLARLGVAQYNGGNHSGAEATYRRLTGDYPSDLDYKTGLGWALLRQGKRTEARQWFAEVLVVSPDNTNARAGMTAR